QEARADALIQLLLVAQHVADVLAQVAFDALAEFLNAVDVLLHHAVVAIGVARPRLEGRNAFLLPVIPRHIGDPVLDHGEGLDRLPGGDRMGLEASHARHTRETRLAVDLAAAGAALPGLAVP